MGVNQKTVKLVTTCNQMSLLLHTLSATLQNAVAFIPHCIYVNTMCCLWAESSCVSFNSKLGLKEPLVSLMIITWHLVLTTGVLRIWKLNLRRLKWSKYLSKLRLQLLQTLCCSPSAGKVKGVTSNTRCDFSTPPLFIYTEKQQCEATTSLCDFQWQADVLQLKETWLVTHHRWGDISEEQQAALTK